MDIISKDVRNYFLDQYTPVDDMLMPLREKGEMNLVPIIMRDTESVLAMLLRMHRPAKILEIGTAIGYSALFFALACPDAEVYTIEMDPLVHETAKRNIEHAAIHREGLINRIHTLQGDGAEQIDLLAEQGIDGFDFIFIDAAKSHYKRFLNSALKVSTDKALIVSDNILIHGMTVSEDADPKRKHLTNVRKMREFLDHICTDEHYKTTLLPIGDGLAISEYER